LATVSSSFRNRASVDSVSGVFMSRKSMVEPRQGKSPAGIGAYGAVNGLPV